MSGRGWWSGDRSPPDEAARSRGVRIGRGDDGAGQVIISLSDLEVEDFAAALQAFIDRRYRPRPVEKSSGGDRPAGELAREEPRIHLPRHRPPTSRRLNDLR